MRIYCDYLVIFKNFTR